MKNRIRLDNDFRISLFDRLLSRNNMTLRQLSVKLKCGYSGLKNWRSGKILIPENIFNDLINLGGSEIKQELQGNFMRYPMNWGQKLGGETANNRPQQILDKKMENARKFKMRTIISPEINNDIWELLGIGMGDGCLSKSFSKYEERWLHLFILTGNMTDDREYYETRILPILKQFNCNATYHFIPHQNCITIRVNSKVIFDYFRKLGMPIGVKKDKIRIPKSVFKSSFGVKAAVLRGLLDTDGHIYARKDQSYKYICLKITSASKAFREDMKYLIREFKIPAYIHAEDVLVTGNSNVKTWMKLIGTSHPINIIRYNTWLLTGQLLPKKGLVV